MELHFISFFLLFISFPHFLLETVVEVARNNKKISESLPVICFVVYSYFYSCVPFFFRPVLCCTHPTTLRNKEIDWSLYWPFNFNNPSDCLVCPCGLITPLFPLLLPPQFVYPFWYRQNIYIQWEKDVSNHLHKGYEDFMKRAAERLKTSTNVFPM